MGIAYKHNFEVLPPTGELSLAHLLQHRLQTQSFRKLPLESSWILTDYWSSSEAPTTISMVKSLIKEMQHPSTVAPQSRHQLTFEGNLPDQSLGWELPKETGADQGFHKRGANSMKARSAPTSVKCMKLEGGGSTEKLGNLHSNMVSWHLAIKIHIHLVQQLWNHLEKRKKK